MVITDIPCSNAPSSWDWRNNGAVTDVKDQGKCSACWAFTTIGAIEGINQIVSQKLPTLSTQQLISCDEGNQGCIGGWYGNAFQYVINNGGIASESDYPYTGDDSGCNPKSAQNKVASIDSYNYWLHNSISESSLLCFVYNQPVSVSIYASKNFQFYNGGIFNGDDCSDIVQCNHNHALLIIGYGSSDGEDYWITKNSWGTTWGQKGYVLIKRNTGFQGVCNINCSGAYPMKGNKEI